MAVTLTNAARSAACNSITALIAAGAGTATIEFLTGGEVLLLTLNFSTTPFTAASNGVATANNFSTEEVIANGTATLARFKDKDGTLVLSCSVTDNGSGGDIEFTDNIFTIGDLVTLTSLTITVPA